MSKISELPVAAATTGTEIVPIVQNGNTVKKTINGLVPGTFSLATNALDFHPTGITGVSDVNDMAAVTAAAADAVAKGRVLFIPPTTAGWLLGVVHLLSTYDGLKIYGDNTVLIHKQDAIIPNGAAEGTKAVPIFMVRRDCHRIEITGFVFRSVGDFTALETSVPGFESYFAPIMVHNSDDVWIHHNRFEGGEAKALFQHGGDRLRLEDNDMGNHAVTIHVGYTNNSYLYDDGNSVIEPTFSPIGTRVARNTWQGYTKPYPLLFLSGCIDFSVVDNKYLESNTTNNILEVYSNDFGLQPNGVVALEMRGVISGNVITGTANYGMYFNGMSNNATTRLHRLALNVHDNTILVTGNGVQFERASDIQFHHNRVNVTKSIFRFARDLYNLRITDNELRSTGNPLGGLAWTNGDPLDMQDGRISGNTIYCGAGSQRWLYTSGTNVFKNMEVTDNIVTFEGTVANPIITQVIATGYLDLSGNRFFINSAAMANRQVVVVLGSAHVIMDRHRIPSSNVQLDVHEIAGASLRMSESDVPGLVSTVTGIVALVNSRFVLSTAGTGQTVKVSNATLFTLTACWVEAPLVLNTATLQAVATLETRLIGNRIIGNSTGGLIRQDTSGKLMEFGNTIINNGTGGTGYITSDTASVNRGRATLVAGTVTVANTSVTATSNIKLTVQSLGTVTSPRAVGVTSRVAGTSFTIASADATDTSVVAWEIL